MPLVKRQVEPAQVSRIVVDNDVRDDLECMTNGTLANLIRNLSSLSKHAEDMFRELSQETLQVCQRARGVQHRIDHVREKVKGLNPNSDVLDLQSITMLKPFSSSNTKEQQVLSRRTVPRAILDLYDRCDAPPALDKLDQFREDGKSSMKFYTDPLYFAELWAKDMDKQFEESKKKVHQKRVVAKNSKQQSTGGVRKAEAKIKDRQKKDIMGREFSDYQDPAALRAKIKDGTAEAERLKQQQLQQQHQQQQQQKYQQHQQQIQEARRQSLRQQQQQLQQQQYYEQQQLLQQQQQLQRMQEQQHQQQQLIYQQNQSQNNINMDGGVHYNADPYTTMPAQYNNGQAGLPNHQQHPPPPPQFDQQRMSPGKVPNGYAGHKRETLIGSPNQRPQAPPPAPPQTGSSRDSLPPPPSPPPPPPSPPPSPPPPMHTPPRQTSMSPQGPRRQGSMSLPPPPTPPPVMEDGNIGMQQNSPPPPPPLPPPPPPLPPASDGGVMTLAPPQLHPNGDSISVSSGSTSVGVPASNVVPPPGSDRSALMQQIIQMGDKKKLRKVEAHEHKKQPPTMHGVLDVQAMMERVMDMRRKVMEDSDPESEGSASDPWEDSD